MIVAVCSAAVALLSAFVFGGEIVAGSVFQGLSDIFQYQASAVVPDDLQWDIWDTIKTVGLIGLLC
jgi:hypothetical protein